MTTVALYTRCSTKDKGQNPETQLLPLREFARQRQLEIAEEYLDLGWSGAKERRPQLERRSARKWPPAEVSEQPQNAGACRAVSCADSSLANAPHRIKSD